MVLEEHMRWPRDLPLDTSLSTFSEVGLVDLCQADGRPIFILDLEQDQVAVPRPVFFNNSLCASSRLFAQLFSEKDHGLLRVSHDRDQADFALWATELILPEESPNIEALPYVHRDFAWTKATLKSRWRVISGLRVRETVSTTHTGNVILSQKVFTVEHIRASDNPAYSSSAALEESARGLGEVNLDWTRSPPPLQLSSHVQFIRGVDWASTDIGPMETWPPLLRSMCNLIIADPTPAGIFWGEKSNMIYNEAFISIAGQKHPSLMGQHPAIPFAEVWDHFEGILEHCRSTGKAVKEEDVCLFLERHGFPEETYVSFTFTPLLGQDNMVVGNYHTVHESTRTKIAERRMSMLLEIGQFTATAHNMAEYWAQVLSALETNENDVPFAILYSVSGKGPNDHCSLSSESSTSYKKCIFEGSLGVAQEHKTLPFMFELAEDTFSFAPAFRNALQANGPVLIQTGDEVFESIVSMTPTEGQRRGFGDPFKSAVICPLRPTNRKDGVGFLIIGLNTRRPYDEEYRIFIDLLTRQMGTSLASTLLYEDERRRGLTAAEQAAEDQARLSAELSLRTKEIKRTEQRFARLMQLAPIGVFIRDTSGQIIYCNDKWYEFMGHNKDADRHLSQAAAIEEASQSSSGPEWNQLVAQKSPVTFETKLSNSGCSPAQIGEESAGGSVWILTSAYPELAEDGTVTSVVGYVTDISQQKWAEAVQQKLVKDALESRRQQEYFIDMTSHEIRNPLSAIMHSADGILTCLKDPRFNGLSSVRNLLEQSIDAAHTVLYCAQHQKNIVDDILTLSKLDSKLLVITPSLTYPVEVAKHTLKMFEAQFSTFGIEYAFDNRLSDEDTKMALIFDPSRLIQVLINLITNAIKFTKGEDVRRITITLKISSTSPSEELHGFEYFPTKNSVRFEDRPGDVYIQFSVTDTGCGLRDNQKDTLFKRFSQASPRTHIQYGGSGLGLFICREIVELQGGQIGVASKYRVGSTFAFYIKAQRPSESPELVNSIGNNSVDQSPVTDLGTFSAGLAIPTVMSLPAEQSSPIRTEGGQISKPNTDSGLKILIVEDNLVNQRVLYKQLKKQACVVYLANHGVEALDFIRKTKLWKASDEPESSKEDLSVILMDIEMPVMDGLTCTREIRRLQNEGLILQHIPIIAVTANARKEQINQIHEAGLDQVISKPFRVVELIALINKTIEEIEAPTT
ncbi:hypothetical protein BP6252_10109 [Coleophoma cylindrospora]|uniref:histidine kinase n=1 Tax=Coleophoma cylindrospora TaxID=1849047 RepID=A0A3D8QY59_9HELO|nr:hypothetical protein BP6252_10109 [Coleophoma cylindrospora]